MGPSAPEKQLTFPPHNCVPHLLPVAFFKTGVTPHHPRGSDPSQNPPESVTPTHPPPGFPLVPRAVRGRCAPCCSCVAPHLADLCVKLSFPSVHPTDAPNGKTSRPSCPSEARFTLSTSRVCCPRLNQWTPLGRSELKSQSYLCSPTVRSDFCFPIDTGRLTYSSKVSHY